MYNLILIFMKPNKLNKKFDEYVAKLPHTGFDLSRDFYFTSAPGMILPVWQHFLQPSEKLSFSCSMKTQSGNTVRPAMLNIPQKIDLFFVPMDMLLTCFGNIFYQTNDFVSSFYASDPFDSASGNFPVFPITSLPALVDFFSADTNNNVTGSLQSTFESKGKSRYRLLQHLGINPASIFDQTESKPLTFNLSTYNPSFFPYMLAAYQAIYQNYYRDDDRELRDLNSYQLDNRIGTSGGTLGDASLFTLRYHSYFRDYFQSLRVSPIASSLNLIEPEDSSAALSKCINYLDNTPINASKGNIQHSSVSYILLGDPASDTSSATEFGSGGLTASNQYLKASSLSTGLIRSLFAVEKLNRISGRARKNYDSQVLAHLGYNVPTDVKHEIRYLGGFDGNVGVKDVISTANTSSDDVSNLGERAGFGVGSLGGKPIEFTAPCHGVVMAVYYAVPEFSYPVNRSFDKLNAITDRLSIPWPEFDRLGMQPMYQYENNINKVAAYNNLQLGWQYRYEQFKRKHDIHTAVFDKYQVNTWSPWVVGKIPFEGTVISNSGITVPLSSFLCAPDCLNDIFVQQYDPFVGEISDYESKYGETWFNRPSTWFQSDPFMHALRVNATLVSFMSTTGEPELI